MEASRVAVEEHLAAEAVAVSMVADSVGAAAVDSEVGEVVEAVVGEEDLAAIGAASGTAAEEEGEDSEIAVEEAALGDGGRPAEHRVEVAVVDGPASVVEAAVEASEAARKR